MGYYFSFTKNVNIVPPSNPVQPNPQSTSKIENSTLDSSVETTSLEDLPGIYITHVTKGLGKDICAKIIVASLS